MLHAYIYNIYTIYIQYIYNIYTIYIQYIYNIYTIYIQYIYNIYTIYIQYIYNIYTIYIQYIYIPNSSLTHSISSSQCFNDMHSTLGTPATSACGRNVSSSNNIFNARAAYDATLWN